MSEAEQDAMEELKKAFAVKNLEVAEKDSEFARLQKRSLGLRCGNSPCQFATLGQSIEDGRFRGQVPPG